MGKSINTDEWSIRLRNAGIDLDGKRILIANFVGTEQEPDLQEPPNCGGVGRIRHFRRATSDGWPSNPLPIDPACRSLGIKPSDDLRAQVFQNAICNWRCWYCFVPFNLLSADSRHSQWLSAPEILDLHLRQPNPPQVIDVTGGQPDLTPEWVLWMLREIKARDLENDIYVWSDDNLSTDYFWRYLSNADIDFIREAKNYGRVCCFKGYDERSFAFNTLASDELFSRQFEIFARLMELDIDLYAYVTLTSPESTGIADGIREFVDRLQLLHTNLPLRTIPLEVQTFTPVHRRLGPESRQALVNQAVAIEAWNRELAERFSMEERRLPITKVFLEPDS